MSNVCCTLGTTGACAFDNLDEIGDVCRSFDLWLHIDSAYAGSAFICPEFRVWMRGIEKADSIAFNPSKWLMVHFDCTALWVTNSAALHRTFNVEPLYLQHENSGLAIDYMHWQIPLSKRFRAIKLWFVIRNYGVKGLQKHIREGVRLAQKFEALVLADNRFEIPATRHLGMVVFRLKGENELTEKLLKRLNHRGNLHAVPASLKGKYVIRFTVTSTHTTNDDIIKDWNEIRSVASEILDECSIKIDKRVLLKDTREKNEAFGSSLLLANSPMSPKVVNGSFAAIIDADEFLAKAYAGIRIANQDSPAMRRRVRGILMSGRQFSLDSRMDLAIQGIEPTKVNNGAQQAIDESEEQSCQEDYEYTLLQMMNLSQQRSISLDVAATHHKVLNNCREDRKSLPPLSSHYDIINRSQQQHRNSLPTNLSSSINYSNNNTITSNSFQSSLNIIDENKSIDEFNDFNFTKKSCTEDFSNYLSDKRQSEPAIRFSFYNKLFDIDGTSRISPTKDYRKFSLPLAMTSSTLEQPISSVNEPSWKSFQNPIKKPQQTQQRVKFHMIINNESGEKIHSGSSFESPSFNVDIDDKSLFNDGENSLKGNEFENNFSDENFIKRKYFNNSDDNDESNLKNLRKICKKCGHDIHNKKHKSKDQI
ncbi:hypothetical protein PVAND_017815 [Polypedilum vanderplanki]|uniref:Histidine decarboxylase n=1 Tax=Polypedilum vanderplanki TaxID=319348 RepID=A0A9J6B957_POLVA|nr:hypothetical protein PVAND_017815 [Polypedilum vanderplanki]